MDLFTRLGGREWVKAVGLKLDGQTRRTHVGLILSDGGSGVANRVTVKEVSEPGKPVVYLVSWWRLSDDGEEADELRAVEVKTAEKAARVIEESLPGTGRVRPEPAEV